MTLIVAALTKKKGFMFGDRVGTIPEKEGSATPLTINGIKLQIKGNVYFKDYGPKIFSIFDNSLYIAMAGDKRKFSLFYNTLNSIKAENFNSYINQYWTKYQDESPDQLLVLSKGLDSVKVEAYFKVEGPRCNTYDHITYIPKDEKLLFVAFGSGASAFLGYIQALNDMFEKQYKKALADETLLQWEEKFIKEIKSIYSDIHHQIDSVGDEVDIVSLELK